MTACRIKATVTNTKGREFEIAGMFWGDGTIRVENPRPKKYPDFLFLYTEPACYDKKDPKRLYWLKDKDADLSELSPFRIKSMLMDPKPVKKPGRTPAKKRV